MPRRPSSTSVSGTLLALREARLSLPEPPPDLRPEALPFWHALTASRTRAEWHHSPADLWLACELADLQYVLRRETELLGVEGFVLDAPGGRRQANPRAGVVDLLGKRELALLRFLRIGGGAGRKREDIEATRQQAREVEAIAADNDDGGLLA
jgi:hypothetical protein